MCQPQLWYEPWTQTWPLAAAWAWIAPRPQLTSRPPTSVWSSLGLLFQFCLFPEHMNHSASFSPPFLHPITMAPTTLVPCGARRAYVSAQIVRTQSGSVGVLHPPGPSSTTWLCGCLQPAFTKSFLLIILSPPNNPSYSTKSKDEILKPKH